MSTFSDMLVYLRKREGYTQADVAQAIGMSASSIGMFERGQREPGIETLEAIADFFNVDMNTLMGSTTGPKQSEAESLLAQLTPENNQRAVDYLRYLLATQEKD